MSRPKRWSEYQDWLDSLPENLQSGSLAEKLEAVCDLDLDTLSDIQEAIQGAEDIDLPLGFGRD